MKLEEIQDYYVQIILRILGHIATMSWCFRDLSNKALGYTFIADVVRINRFIAMSHERKQDEAKELTN